MAFRLGVHRLLIVAILLMVGLGAYRSVERMVIASGCLSWVSSHGVANPIPTWASSPRELHEMPIANHDYLYLLAANLGTSVMPWAIFYQQSALIDKGLGPPASDARPARHPGRRRAVSGRDRRGANLPPPRRSVIARNPCSWKTCRKSPVPSARHWVRSSVVWFSCRIGGRGLVATITVCLTAAWALGEVAGFHHSLEHHPLQAPWFYAVLALILLLGGALVPSGVNFIRLSIAMGVVNALLLPVALGFLYQLARTRLAEPLRLKGAYAAAVGTLFFCAAASGVYAALPASSVERTRAVVMGIDDLFHTVNAGARGVLPRFAVERR